ncbi:MAG: diaminopimelate epimerase [Deltaproteobacteria bacterium]|nr:diaminopimelate epimerase [Deltaproteobacteria bacterium]
MNFPIEFTKMSGTGNDFIIIDHRRPFLEKKEMGAFAKAVCRRKFSVGADGLILLENVDGADFRWHFYNGDGSEAEMCGNGARCAARFAHAKGIAPAKMSFLTMAGTISAEVKEGGVRLAMTTPADLALDHQVGLAGVVRKVHFLNTGVPHAVCFVDSNAATPVPEWGASVRFHELFQPAGANANFVEVLGPDALHVRTYERGVEDETMACGTGAVASAIIGGMLGLVRAPVKVTTSGGEILTIHFELGDKRKISAVFLEGPAHFIYEGLLNAEALL